MAKVVIIGDKHTVHTFKMLGFPGIVVSSGKELLKVLDELKEQEDIAVILVTSNLVDEVRSEFNRLRLKISKPILMEIPTLREVKYQPVDYLGILRAALGI